LPLDAAIVATCRTAIGPAAASAVTLKRSPAARAHGPTLMPSAKTTSKNGAAPSVRLVPAAAASLSCVDIEYFVL
jgi:hypothetical protein